MAFRVLCVVSVIAGVASKKLNLSVTGLQWDRCTTEFHDLLKSCDYTYNHTRVGSEISLKCTLNGRLPRAYNITFETRRKQVVNKDKQRSISNQFRLTGKNETKVCTVPGDNPFTFKVNLYYKPPPQDLSVPSTLVAGQLTTPVPSSTQNTEAATQSDEHNSNWWLKFVYGGVVVFIFLSVVCCVIACYCRKKPPPDDSRTYVNLIKDPSSYQTLPVAASRMLKQGAPAKGSGGSTESAYSIPKDSHNMSEALYADPTRFNGSDTYSEPYLKSAPQPTPKTEPNKSDYAEPYMLKPDGNYAIGAKSEGNYAEIGVKSEGNYAEIGAKSEGNYAIIGAKSEGNYAVIGAKSEGNYAVIGAKNNDKELYAKPIPKANRPIKVKDESNYSNVFTEQYANTK